MELFNINSQTNMFENDADPFFAATRKIYDPIHNFIVFDQDIWNFIDTTEFQRLRDVKQLGGVSYVFQGATHTRFEHCLGTGYLAQKQVKNIYKYQPDIVAELDSSENAERIKKNITLAGLMHDLGHALFSHLFDGTVIPKLCPGSKWTHEQGSAMLIEKLIDDNHIDIDKENIEMIKDLVLGNNKKQIYQEKAWIFDIVANKRNSIDVDKYDYMRRDSYHLGLKDTTFDYGALMKEARVINNEICFPAKLCHKVYELFQARYKLYKGIYHNRAAEAIEIMVTEVLLHANSRYKFAEAINDPQEYVKLTDYILRDIEVSTCPELEKSRQILKRLRQRDTYKFASETILDYHLPLPDSERMKVDILSFANNQGDGEDLKLEDFEVTSGTNNFAFKDKNPVECVKFYNKKNIKKSFFIDKEQVSLLLPAKFCERYLRIYVRSASKISKAKEAFQKYCKNYLNVKTTPIESKNTPSKNRGMIEEIQALEPQISKKLFTQVGDDQKRPPALFSRVNLD